MNVFVIIAIIAVVLIISVFVFKILSENKAKMSYTPPTPAEKIVLPDIDKTKLPAKSAKRLHFCKKCGSANSDKDSNCCKCGSVL